MLLYLIRHGDPIYEPDMLTPLGRRQAEALAKRLALYGVDRIFSSPSQRALETAVPTSELTKLPIEQLLFCDEALAWEDFGIPNGTGGSHWCFFDSNVKKAFASKEVLALADAWYTHPAFEAYTFRRGVERMDRETDKLLRSLGYEHLRQEGIYRAVAPTEERVALFAHQGFGLSFLSSVLDIPYPLAALHMDMGHSGMSVIEFQQAEGIAIPKLLTLSNDSHLYRDGLPTSYQGRVWF